VNFLNMKNKVIKIKLKSIISPAGNIIKYLSKKDRYFKQFGEIYFNQVKKGYVKGWNLHKESTCLISVVYGSVEFTTMDYYKKNKKKYVLKSSKPSLLIIPPKKWFKFKSLDKISMISNLINKVHSPNETLKLSLNDY